MCSIFKLGVRSSPQSGISRRSRIGRRNSVNVFLAAAIAILIAAGFTQEAQAQWIDAATGRPVPSGPIVGQVQVAGSRPQPAGGPGFRQYDPAIRPGDNVPVAVRPEIGDPNRAFDPASGRNFFFDPSDCQWKNAATGRTVPSGPIVGQVQVAGSRPQPAGGPGFRQYDPAIRPGDNVPVAVRPEIGDPNRAFDPASGRNFVRVPCRPTTTTTVPSTPQIGMVVEPKIGVGIGGSSGTSAYDSTGGQLPFSGDWSRTTGQICGGATFWPGFVVGPARVGLDVNVCSGTNTFGGDTTLFQINRHGPGGDVDLRASTNAIIDVLFKGEVPVGPANNWFFSAGIGPSFRQLDLTLTSNQSFFGGGIPSASESTWQTGLGVMAGLSTFVCPNCVGGNPLRVGVEGRARFFPSQSISLRSPTFGFTETGSTGRTTDYSALVTFGVPFSTR
jgi:hypothetical protein